MSTGLIAHHLVVGERAEPAKIARGPLVGRDRELARLEKSWARAQAGTLTTPGVVFRGEPGIGKSRLAAAAAELVEHSGAVVLELIGSPFHTDAGLHPVRTLIERRCGIGRLTDPAERLRLLQAEVRGPVGWIRRPRCRYWRRCWGSAPRRAMSRCPRRAASSTS